MSGHSKWSTIHRQKEVKDAARGNLFSKLGRAITIAVKSGGGDDPESNFKLRVAVDKARAANMPKENIERAIARGAGATDLEEVSYEGFGPSGIAVIVEAATDNKNRTAQEIKNIFERGGGRLSGPGTVSYNFSPRGLLVVKKENDLDSEMLRLIDAGVEELEETESGIEAYVSLEKFGEIRNKLALLGFEITQSELVRKPKNVQTINDAEAAKKALTFLEKLSDHDDVQKVFANLDIPEDLAKKLI